MAALPPRRPLQVERERLCMRVEKVKRATRKLLVALAAVSVFGVVSPTSAGAWVSQRDGYNQRFSCLVSQFWWWNRRERRFHNLFEGYAAADNFYSAMGTIRPVKRPPRHRRPRTLYGIGIPKGASARRYVLIDKSQHHMWVFVDGRVVAEMATVDSDRATPVGTMYANRCVVRNGGILPNFIGLDTTMDGTWYSHLGRRVYSGIGIHGIPYRSGTAVAGNQTYSTSLLGKGVRQSAGCVNVSRPDAAFLFHFMLPGVPAVITAGSSKPTSSPEPGSGAPGNLPIDSDAVQLNDPAGQ
ncbi:MAG: L,D-transpeptidase [Microthrixaceae bacterium]